MAALCGAVLGTAVAAGSAPATSILSTDPDTLAQGAQLFATHCRPCHGDAARGQDPARPMGGADAEGMHLAPALNGTGHAWHHPPRYLVETVRDGTVQARSAMAGWGDRLDEGEILGVVAWFQSLWPAHIRAAYAQRYLGAAARDPLWVNPRPAAPAPAPQAVAGAGPVPIGALTFLWGPTADIEGFRDGLVALGHRTPEAFVLGVRSALGDAEGLPAMLLALQAGGARLVYVNDPQTLAAAIATPLRIPVVYGMIGAAPNRPPPPAARSKSSGVWADPLASRPAALGWLLRLAPEVRRVVVVFDAGDDRAREILPRLEEVARRRGARLMRRGVATRAQARATIAAVPADRETAILPLGSRYNLVGYVLEATLARDVPAIFAQPWTVDYGALASFGPTWRDVGHGAARLAARVLESGALEPGAADLPVPPRLGLNLRTARRLGLTPRPELLDAAQRVVR